MSRWRYDPEQNVEFWGLSFSNTDLKWTQAGIYSFARAHDALMTVASAIALCTTASLLF